MTPLADYQQAFVAALLRDDAAEPGASGPGAGTVPEWLERLATQPGFAVYRNTVIKGCVDALQANFAAVARLVGSEWMRAAAGVYARSHLPRGPMLLDYGATFPAFLEGFEPAAGMPWLPAVATLDRLWIESHSAADARPLDAHALLTVEPAVLLDGTFALHPAARWMWCGHAPAYTIWARNRVGHAGTTHATDEPDAADAAPVDWRPEGALLVRPDDVVQHRAVGPGAIAFLAACAGGGSVGTASLAALDADPGTDLHALIGALIAAGAFATFHPRRPAPDLYT